MKSSISERKPWVKKVFVSNAGTKVGMPEKYSLVAMGWRIRRSAGVFRMRKGICRPVTDVGYCRVRDSPFVFTVRHSRGGFHV